MYLFEFLLISSYAFLGAGVKYIDQAYDEDVFSKTKANVIAVFSGLLMAGLVITDPFSASIFIAMVAALIATGKIDNKAFIAGTGIVLVIPTLLHRISLNLPLLSALFAAGGLDEVMNDRMDRRSQKRPSSSAEKALGARPFMKLVVLAFALASYLPAVYAAAFLFFDTAYLLFDDYGTNLKIQKTIDRLWRRDVEALLTHNRRIPVCA